MVKSKGQKFGHALAVSQVTYILRKKIEGNGIINSILTHQSITNNKILPLNDVQFLISDRTICS